MKRPIRPWSIHSQAVLLHTFSPGPLVLQLVVAPQVLATKVVAPQVLATKVVAPQVLATKVVAPQLLLSYIVLPQSVSTKGKLPHGLLSRVCLAGQSRACSRSGLT
jgi:hypothetical protein